MRIALLIILVILIIVCGCGVKQLPALPFFNNECMVISSVDNQKYIVREDFKNKQTAANILGEINAMYVRLIKHLKRNKMNTRWAPDIIFLANNYNPDVLGEHIPFNTNYTSYVRNKGKKIRMCLRSVNDRNKFIDMNTLKFVAIHELSHMMTKSMGHENDFWEAFQFLLLEASSIGEIKLIRYSQNPTPYCGITITANPAFDKKINFRMNHIYD